MDTINSFSKRAQAFKALHERRGIFVAPNPWDAGSARMLEQMGFEALATSSAGLAWSLGKPDGRTAISRELTLNHATGIRAATRLPVSADMENGFGDDPSACADTVLLFGNAGLSGGSIEDATGKPDDPIYAFDAAVERVRAAAAAAKTLSQPFLLTARAENFLYGRPDIQDVIKRLVAFADAGADVLFAPGLTTKEQIGMVVKAVAPKPVNVIMGLAGANFSIATLAELGVKRISVGSSLVRVAYGAFFRAITEINQKGTFGYAEEAISYANMNKLFSM
ncbi:MAG: isocitrate lyase/phosphoenolpyruvate mutase family protein [Agriterribacter sp.]